MSCENTPPLACEFEEDSQETALKLSGTSGKCNNGGGKGDGKGDGERRPMKFPYTFSAKIAQFPLRHYYDKQWIWKYYFIALACCVPVFWKISRLSNSKENKEKWAAIREKRQAEQAAHDDDEEHNGGEH